MAKDNPHELTKMVLQLASMDKYLLGTVRCLPNLQALDTDQSIWLRGIDADNIPLLLQQLPSIGRYYEDAQKRLFPVGGLTPIGTLAAGEWQPIKQFIPVEVPSSAFPGKTDKQYRIQLIPAETEHKAAALLADLIAWKNYVEGAPQIRLDQLQFAVSATNEVLIIGYPLPPIPGRAYWKQDLLLIPNGYDFDLSNMANLLNTALNQAQDAYLLFQETGTYQKVFLEQLVPTTRSAVRLSGI